MAVSELGVPYWGPYLEGILRFGGVYSWSLIVRKPPYAAGKAPFPAASALYAGVCVSPQRKNLKTKHEKPPSGEDGLSNMVLFLVAFFTKYLGRSWLVTIS